MVEISPLPELQPDLKPRPRRRINRPSPNGVDGKFHFNYDDDGRGKPMPPSTSWHVPYVLGAVIFQIVLTLFAAGMAWQRVVNTEMAISELKGEVRGHSSDITTIKENVAKVLVLVDKFKR